MLYHYTTPIKNIINLTKACQQLTTFLNFFTGNFLKNHCVKSVRIRSYSGPYFPAFGLNTER